MRLIILSVLLVFVSLSSLLPLTRITVAKNGGGDFITIQAALNSLPTTNRDTFIIFIKNGVYNEKLFIERNCIALVGESKDSTIIIFAELRKNWRENHENDYGAGVVNIKNKITDIVFNNLTIHNNYGALFGDNDHQFAVRAGEGVSRIIIDNCNIVSDGGDAVALWNTDDGMYYHRDSHFEGFVDYVCPRGYCFIENSTFYGRNLTASIWHDGSKNEDHKFVIRNSRFDGVEGFPLGRFHRDAQFILVDCTFSKTMADKKIFFAPSNPPRILQWGEDRIYFYNCHLEGDDFEWHKNNLDKMKNAPNPNDITPSWTFDNKWDPISQLEQLNREIK